MKLDDYKAGKLPPDDPWVQEMSKRGLLGRRKHWGVPHAVEEGVKPENNIGEHQGVEEVRPSAETGSSDSPQPSAKGSQTAQEIVQ